MQLGTVDMNKMRGIADKSVGLGKEFVGTLIGNDRLVKEGEAQQDRAAEELRALRKEVEAQKNEAKAEVLEQRQRAAQRSKENA